ncbi:TPA: hypothetical protein DIS56_00985 [Candidatus Saccharibacteria bacterium]|nr:hypothetical protein [Candidatus Saccharibacteria bacterium]
MKKLLSGRIASLEESATLALNAKVKQMQAEGREVFNLTAGELDFSTPDYIQKSVAGQLDQNKYTAAAGLPGLRQAIAQYENKRLGLSSIEAANIVVTAGAKTGLYGLLQVLLNPGDEVILPIPAWVSYVHMITLAGGQAIPVPLTPKADLDAETIKKSLTPKTKLIIINSPHNPTGAVFSKKALTNLARTIKGKPVMVISDEIYATLTYGKQFVSIAELGLPLKQTLIINGFSKSQALTGWRIGYAVAPTEIASALTSFLSHATGNAALPGQLAALAALKKNNQPQGLGVLKKRERLVETQLKKTKAIRFSPPGGAFYFWLDIRSLTKNSTNWCEQLLHKTGVALVPGDAFFAPGFARLSFAADEKVLAEAMQRLRQFVEKR